MGRQSVSTSPREMMTNRDRNALPKELKEAIERYQLALEATSDGVWDWDIESNREYFAPRWCEILGYNPDDPELERTFDFWASRIHPDDRPGVMAALDAHLTDGKPYNVDYRHRYRDGSYRWQNSRGKAIVVDGKPVRMVGAIRDIQEAKDQQSARMKLEQALVLEQERNRSKVAALELEARLQKAQRLESLAVLAGGIAHDFNNLLVGILGNAGLALMNLPEESPARDIVKAIETASLRAADLTKQMLAYSGKGRFEVAAIDLSVLVAEMSHLLEVAISKKNVLRLELSEPGPVIEGDPTQIRQVVMNLLTNASEAIGERSGLISIITGSVEADAAYLSTMAYGDDAPPGIYGFIEVSDTGCGMSPEVSERMFDPFFSTKNEGHGLGLAAMLGIVQGHNGAVRVYSEVGSGTTIKVLLPLGQSTTQRPLAAAQERRPRRGLILVVDDEEDVRAVSKRTLQMAGYSVTTAVDGHEGLEIFESRKEEIRAVLLDMTMPRVDGKEAFRRMTEIDANVRVILMSGYNEQDATSSFAGKDLAGFIQKPFRPQDLIVKVAGLLGSTDDGV